MKPIISFAGFAFAPTRQRVRCAIEINNQQAYAWGQGNRARRRAGLPVIDSTSHLPFGMSDGELSRFLRTKP